MFVGVGGMVEEKGVKESESESETGEGRERGKSQSAIFRSS